MIVHRTEESAAKAVLGWFLFAVKSQVRAFH
jgi:hypothetical protein